MWMQSFSSDLEHALKKLVSKHDPDNNLAGTPSGSIALPVTLQLWCRYGDLTHNRFRIRKHIMESPPSGPHPPDDGAGDIAVQRAADNQKNGAWLCVSAPRTY